MLLLQESIVKNKMNSVIDFKFMDIRVWNFFKYFFYILNKFETFPVMQYPPNSVRDNKNFK